jgi:alanine racemase
MSTKPHGPPPGYRATWAEVDLDRIASNFAALRALAGREAAVFPVVKANAYGHGAMPVARRIETEGAAGLCVATPEEGLELRRGGISLPILCLGAVEPLQIVAAARSQIILTLYSPHQVRLFEDAGRASGVPVRFHLKVETGMNRLGVLPEELGPLLDELRGCRAALLSGVFSNLAAADRPGEGSNAEQGERLTAAAAAVRAAGHEPRPVHLANSAGLLYHPALRFDAVRPGLLLYGIRPGSGDSGPGFAPALSLKTTVLRVKSVPAGAAVGYSATWRAPRESRLATLAIGYDDGLPRALGGKGEVLIGGRRAPLVGVVSMDLCVADVTDCGEVAPGAEVVVIGTQGQETIGASDLAERAGTIPWEILCGIGRRVPRVHVAGNAAVSIACVLPPVKDVAPVPEKEPPKRRGHAHDAAPATVSVEPEDVAPEPQPEPREA